MAWRVCFAEKEPQTGKPPAQNVLQMVPLLQKHQRLDAYMFHPSPLSPDSPRTRHLVLGIIFSSLVLGTGWQRISKQHC